MRVCVMAGLPGRSVATTSTCTTKWEHFDEIRTHGKRKFQKRILEMVKLFKEIII